MNKIRILLAVSILLLSVQVNAALISRLGGLAYYDNEADLTWLADANAGGAMAWDSANTWAAGLDVGGVTGWRLPNTVDVGNDGATFTNIYQGVDYGYNITTHSELSNMFHNVLGNTSFYDISGTEIGCIAPNHCLANTVPFSNLQSGVYWSATPWPTNTGSAWVFLTSTGTQDIGTRIESHFAWAVHDGDIGVVPAPATIWLFGTGLLGFIGFSKRRKSA